MPKNKCAICGKPLNRVSSRSRGMGKTCYQKHLRQLRKNKLFETGKEIKE